MKKRSAAALSSQITLDLGDPGGLFPLRDINGADVDDAEGSDYPFDPDDSLPAEEVKAHCRDKHALLLKYVDICSAVRNKYAGWGGSNCYIDLYCGPGRVHFNDVGQFAHGSPLVAWEGSQKLRQSRDTRFAKCFIGDLDAEFVRAARKRLEARGATVHAFQGEASRTVEQVLDRLPSKGFHFAFLDPYNIGTLPFSVIERLASVKTLDILLHFSVMDLRRNMARFISRELPYLDIFAPGWQEAINPLSAGESNVRAVEAYWKKKVEQLGKPARGVELVRGTGGNHLYWLVLLSRSNLAEKFFAEVSVVGKQRDLWSASS